MDPPSSSGGGGGGGGGGGDGGDSTSRNINQMAFCHECGIEIRPLMTPDPTCPRCNGQFVEIIDETSASHLDGLGDDDDPFAALHGDPFPGFSFRTGGMGGTAAPPLSFVQGGSGGQIPGGLGGLLMALASGAARPPAAGAGRAPQSPESEINRRSSTDQDGDRARSGSGSSQTQGQNSTRSGSTSFGPFGLQWNVQYGSGGGDPYQRAAQHQAEHNTRSQQQQQSDFRSPPTLSNFLRFAFGPDSNTDPTQQPNEDTYFHDDGMGGAGGVADGRHFNHDNRGTYHQPPQSPNSNTDNNNRTDADLPPELSALRNLFTGLFGEPGAQGGSLLDILASGAHGGGMGARGQWGDYVLGQQGLDDIISQLMEQTQGSNAPPPATEEVIDQLERFTLNDKQRIEKAKNQDCPTCKDEFLPSTESESESHKNTRQEEGEQEQQEDLISMPCGHIFHLDCLVPWLRLHGTCPVCRVSIVKPMAENENEASSSSTNSNSGNPTMQGRNSIDDPSETVPGIWPSPPNPFTSLFGAIAGANTGVTIPRDSSAAAASAATETERYHPHPPTSTTVTSTVYPSPPPTTGNVQVVNSIVSSPPIVSDREEFFSSSTPATTTAEEENGAREDMRERMRRAAEARVGSVDQGQSQNQQREGGGGHPNLEPDELD